LLTGSYTSSATGSAYLPANGVQSATFSAQATGVIVHPGNANLSASAQLRAVGNAFLPAQGAIYATFSASAVGRVFPFTEPGSVTGDFKTGAVRGSYKVGKVEGDFKTAQLQGRVKPLAESNT